MAFATIVAAVLLVILVILVIIEMKMSTSANNPFTLCPKCGKNGVQFHFAKAVAGEDGHGCRYCDFWFFDALATAIDRRLHDEWVAVNHHCATCGGFLVGGDEWDCVTAEEAT